ncbi:site-specific integrase [Rufibacter sediminis]|uniref:Site-specific integrase n=1 Tax=Rufibacter sediminis TaxID=2762756 RepID=A0ABR6VX64_9BACT|nr:site-specific integrase [Rufibacter sediminis]MBC3541388.1 site-specific integrase [Rufibacter sediminis]
MKSTHTFTVSSIIRKSKANKQGEVPIYVRITVDGESLEISTKHFVKPTQWDSRRGRVKGKGDLAKAVNETIELLQIKAKQEYNNLVSLGKPITSSSIKNGVLGIEEEGYTLLQLFDKMLDDVKAKIGVDLNKDTYKSYISSQKHIYAYVKEHLGLVDIKLKDVNYKFVSGYELYLKTKGGCGQNGTVKHIVKLKKVITMALRYDYINRDPFSEYSIHLKKKIVKPLLDSELILIESKEFSSERLNVVKDMFLFTCYTGLAFTDVKQLTKDNLGIGVDGKEWIFRDRQKTDVNSCIPLLVPAKRILQQYENHPKVLKSGCLLPVPSNQKFNAYLKEIADLCGITKNLTVHLGRHTFATTVALQNGVPLETVSKMLGHTSIKTTQIYAKVLDTKVSRDMANLVDTYKVEVP